jgi:hypothetical protein
LSAYFAWFAVPNIQERREVRRTSRCAGIGVLANQKLLTAEYAKYAEEDRSDVHPFAQQESLLFVRVFRVVRGTNHFTTEQAAVLVLVY